MKAALLVGLGGAIGSMLRYGTTVGIQRILAHPFPHQTLWVNVAGCLLIGLLGGLTEHRGLLGDHAKLFLLVGVFGGFTTFSTFGYETLALWQSARPFLAFSNVILHVSLSLSAVWCGCAAARFL
jgi:CrcB protein